MQDDSSKLPRRDYFQNTLQNTFIIKITTDTKVSEKNIL